MAFYLDRPYGPGTNWYIRGTIPKSKGKRVFKSTGTKRQAEAKDLLDKANKDLHNGKLGLKVASFAKAANDYITDVNPGQTQQEIILGVENKDGSLRPCLLTYFGHVEDCREIDQEMVNDVIEKHFKKTKHDRPYKPGTILRQLIVPLSALLTHAADYYKVCDKPSLVWIKANDERERWATREELTRLFRASAPHVVPIWMFALYIGDRIGESVKLQIEDVQLDERWAVLRDTKNGTSRGIALHAQVVEILRQMIGDRKSGPVFLTDRGEPYATYPKKAWRQACERAEIQNLRLHDMRHTFGTLSGKYLTTRQQEAQMGHTNSSMNARYVHVPDEELIEALNGMPWFDFVYYWDYDEWRRAGYGAVVPRSDVPIRYRGPVTST